MSTFVPSGKDIDRKWFVIDASGQTLGRLATKAASVLSGKLNPQYTPHLDMGDHVIVINAEPTPFDPIASAVIRGSISEVLPALVNAGS